MKLPAGSWWFGIATLISATGQAQMRPEWIQDKYENLDFAAGKTGDLPPGWHLGPVGTREYAAETVSAGSCAYRKQCAMVKRIGTGPNNLSFLYQAFDATAYREKKIRFFAAVRADVPSGSAARLLVRIHRIDGSTSFRDDMGNHPIVSGRWAFYEIEAPIIFDARDVEFGIQLVGKGAAWIDQISLEFPE